MYIITMRKYHGNMCKEISKKDKAKAKNSVQSAIRQSFARSDYYKAYLEQYRVEWYSGKRKRVSYKCHKCSELRSKPDINVDHIIPIGNGAYTGLQDAEHFYKLVYCSYDNLQILCKDTCHKEKTALEKKRKSFHNMNF